MPDYPLEVIRHSLAHILAAAVTELYPNVRPAIGPAIDNGFYYDFDFGPDKLSEDQLPLLNQKMLELIAADLPFNQEIKSAVDALAAEQAAGQTYKAEIIADLQAQGETEVSYYTVGQFADLCRGPHVASTADLRQAGFLVHHLAGAYWRGSEKNKMLTRVYALAFNNQVELDNYLQLLAEAEQRDHRKLGRELDLFHIDEQVGLGLPLWHPKGAILWKVIEDFWSNQHLRNGYSLVRSPHIGNKTLWETSGHWGFYNASMYPPLEAGQTLEERQRGVKVKESEEYLLKPMNCPFHIEIYQNKPRSYRELPLRYAECGTVYRYEKKGELSGLTRVRGFTQDDAHIICRADQVENELKRVVDFILFIFKSFGFDTDLISVYLSLRDPENKSKYAGSDEGWEFTEQVLKKVAIEKKLNFKEEKGEAAFYGPKLDFKLKDALGREWQCSTLQFDFNLPERFTMNYTNSQGQAEQPYVLHRALFGSFERFIALLIENYAGVFPLWLSPVQVKILTVNDQHHDYCQQLADKLRYNDIRVEVDESDETVGNKIRKAATEKIPYVLVVGDKEIASGQLAVRQRGQTELLNIDQDGFLQLLQEKIKQQQ
ncbi:MAG TPA: threonine--tRNA ligase [bacterium]|nr:threonine--tRNA ligase [bacterium]HNZ51572.1 threonine--tRNA ligase [bacterium]HOF79474.1 threonine--tRNA ligase [bacterium]HOH85255.1 threonine--tRNA ligase [bacterium]HOQ91850.1 threonine--tRNA ligase [bacterium]